MYEFTHVIPQIFRDDRLGINFLSLTAKNFEAKEADRRTCYRHQKKIEMAFWRPKKIKFSLSKNMALSVFSYECWRWKFTTTLEKRIDICQTNCLRGIFKLRWQHHFPNKTGLEMIWAENISSKKKVGMMDWIGHVLKIDPKDDCNVVLGGRYESGVTYEVRK